MIDHGIFGPGVAFEKRYIPDYEKITKLVSHCKGLGMKVVLTSGSFDLLHWGHALYLDAARSLGDILIVGVDSDTKIQKRKNRRAVVPEDERIHLLTELRSVDVVTLKTPEMEHLALVKAVRPDVLVKSKTTKVHGEEEIIALKEFCGEVRILEPQATGSTGARIRLMLLDNAKGFATRVRVKLDESIPEAIAEALQEVEDGQ